MGRWVLLLFLGLMGLALQAQEFIQTQGNDFVWRGRPYRFLGTNLWYAAHLAADLNPGDLARLRRELDRLHSLGVRNVRVLAASEGPDDAPWRIVPALQPAPQTYNEALLRGLDRLLLELAQRDMHAVVVLGNFWPWSGGMAQYVSWATDEPIPYPPPAKEGRWVKYMKFAGRFFKTPQAQHLYFEHVRKILSRKNSLTGIPYRDDPTIMAWQLANEPRSLLHPKAYYRWVESTARFIKSLDPNHLVSVGSEGNALVPWSAKFRKEHRFAAVDYATCHLWVQNWGWHDPRNAQRTWRKTLRKARKYIARHLKTAERLGKPLVLEEFGLARDNGSHAAGTSTEYRNLFFQAIFEEVHRSILHDKALRGVNFWAWAGEGRPRTPRAIWEPGDAFTGDPPFEHQGWYSVFDTDESTLEIIRAFAGKINSWESQ